MLLDMTNYRKNTGNKYLFYFKRALAVNANQTDTGFNLGLKFDKEKNWKVLQKRGGKINA